MSQPVAARHHEDAWSWQLLEYLSRHGTVTRVRLLRHAKSSGWIPSSEMGLKMLRTALYRHEARGRIRFDEGHARFIGFSRRLRVSAQRIPLWSTGGTDRKSRVTTETCQDISGSLRQFVATARKAYSGLELTDRFAAVPIHGNDGIGNGAA